jgi:hypothetical protein
MRRWRIIAGTALSTFALGWALIALLLVLRHGPTSRLRITWHEYGPTLVDWDADPMQSPQPGFVEGRPIKVNARCLGVHLVKAAGEEGSMGEIWLPYVWIFLGGVAIAFFTQRRITRRSR